MEIDVRDTVKWIALLSYVIPRARLPSIVAVL